MACAIVAKKLVIPCAHVEAGLRSFDTAMPEEINRIVTDSICDLYFTTDPEGNRNLAAMGAAPDSVHFAGNVMIDTLLRNRQSAEANPVLELLGLKSREYCLLTMHRPSNVDNRETLGRLIEAFEAVQARIPMVFPAHPRSVKMLESFGYLGRVRSWKGFRICEPLDYHAMLKMNAHARFVITDSGGLQEETTVLGIPCITIRENTERPVTVRVGSNELVGTETSAILDAVNRILGGRWKKGGIPEGWDGKASERIVAVLEKALLPAG
jgi:UDP-N-acetylglucosamine 2-epimerase (non-hydrolysing)